MSKFILVMLCFLICMPACAAILTDELVESTLYDTNKPEAHTSYNYQSTERLPVRLRIVEKISSEKDVYEGQEVSFKVQTSVYYKGKLVIEKGTIVPARVETLVKSGMNGIPAGIIVGNFSFENISKGQITDSYEITGQDRSLWVFPLKWALTFLPPTGSLTNFIKGGHAKLKEDKTIEIYYYPNWI